jgi:type II secretory pathway pseudopilin PulG
MKHGRAFTSERGYAMAALLVAISVMAIAISTALPVFQTVVRREKEAELVFRGEQYARAIGMFQRRYGNALPPDIDTLVRDRFLRKKYKDPITGGDFLILGPGSPELAQALNTPPQVAGRAGRGAQPTGRGGLGGLSQPAARGGSRSGTTQPQFGRGAVTQPGAATGQAAGGVLAVASKSTQTSMRLYNGKDKYNEWVFMALQTSTAAGAPPGVGGQTPGVRGAAPGVRGAAPGGRRGAPAPARGGRGRGL